MGMDAVRELYLRIEGVHIARKYEFTAREFGTRRKGGGATFLRENPGGSTVRESFGGTKPRDSRGLFFFVKAARLRKGHRGEMMDRKRRGAVAPGVSPGSETVRPSGEKLDAGMLGEEYRSFLDTLPYAIVATDLEGTVLFGNRTFNEEFRGAPVVWGRTWAGEYGATPESKAKLRNHFSYLVEARPDPTPWLDQYLDQNGEVRDIRVEWRYRRDGAGMLVGFLALVTDVTEITKEKRQKEERLALLEAILESSTDGIFMKDREGVFRMCNRAAAALAGFTQEETVGRNVSDLISVEAAAAINERDRQVMESGEPSTVEVELRTPRCPPRFLSTTRVPYRVPGGRVIGIFGISRDITEKKRAEETLRKAHERLRAHVENSPLAVIEWDSDFHIVRWSGEAERAFGWPAEEVLGKRIGDIPLVYEADHHLVERVMADMLSGARPVNVNKNRNVRKDGSVIHCEWYNSAIHDESGRLVSILSQVLDVTERKTMEMALRESEERFRAFMDSSPILAWIRDEEGRIVYLNRPYEHHLRLPPGGWRGKNVDEFWPKEMAEAFREVNQAVLETGRTLHTVEETPSPEGGHSHWLISRFPLRDQSGRRYVGGAALDITELKQAEEALQGARDELESRVRERTTDLETAKRELERDIEARKTAEEQNRQLEAQLRQSQVLEAVGRLAGGVAHDFNNLLGAVLACAWAAGVPEATAEEIQGELGRIKDLCKQGGDVSRQLMALARQTPTTSVPLDLRQDLMQLRNLVERACPKTVTVIFDLAEDLPPVLGDRALFTTALLNLCLNARDAMPKGGTLTLRAGRERAAGRDWALISVRDTGYGIPEEMQGKIFQPFFTTKASGRGVGLGLPLASSTVKTMGGALELQSAPGEGALFTLRIPALIRSTENSAPAPRGWKGRSGGNARIGGGIVLVVEDEEDIARMAAYVLAREGFEVLSARTGLEALEIVRDRSEEVGLVLLDLVLPELSGASVHHILTLTAPRIPVVFMTGREDLAAEADPTITVLRKPFTEDDLVACVCGTACRYAEGA
jgi:PAS domain S-box-containing protein